MLVLTLNNHALGSREFQLHWIRTRDHTHHISPGTLLKQAKCWKSIRAFSMNTKHFHWAKPLSQSESLQTAWCGLKKSSIWHILRKFRSLCYLYLYNSTSHTSVSLCDQIDYDLWLRKKSTLWKNTNFSYFFGGRRCIIHCLLQYLAHTKQIKRYMWHVHPKPLHFFKVSFCNSFLLSKGLFFFFWKNDCPVCVHYCIYLLVKTSFMRTITPYLCKPISWVIWDIFLLYANSQKH